MAGRPPALRSITNAVMTRNQLEMFDCTPRELYGAMNEPMRWLQWLAEHRLIRNSNDCGICQQPMALVRRAESPEGFSWKCRACNTRASVRTGSFFAHCVLGVDTIVMMMFYWAHEVKSKHVMLFEGIDDWHNMVNYNNFFRVECDRWLNRQQVDLGGFDGNGLPIYVEVDESYFFHRKYNRGRRRRGCWVVGLVERATGKCWLEIVVRRDAQTLERIISDHVLPGTVIVTDAWAGYADVSTINNGIYDHLVVVHAENFVHAVHDDIHTQNIEGLWMQAKRKLRFQAGTSRALFPSYLAEFQWRFSHKAHVYGQYLKLISENYAV